jgi:hypothetical protein
MPANNNPFMDLDVSPSPAPTQSPSNENPFLAAPIVDQSALPPQQQPVSPFMSTIEGINQQYETLPQTIAAAGAGLTDNLGITNNAKQSVNDFYANRSDQYQKAIDQNPRAGMLGKIIGGVAESAPLFAAAEGFFPMALAGGAAGFIGTDSRADLGQKLVNTGLGALGGVAGNTLGQAAKAYSAVRGLDPSQLAELATQKTLQKLSPGKDLSDVTPGSFFQTVDDMADKAKPVNDAFYDTRNKIAESEGAVVTKNNLSALVDTLSQKVKQGATGDTVQALKEARRLLGQVEITPAQKSSVVDISGKPISETAASKKMPTASYKDAQDLLSDIRGSIYTANSQRNFSLANKLKPIKQAIEQDIEDSPRSEELNAAHQVAQNYFKNVYNPLSEFDARQILTDHYADSSYMASALNKVLKNPQTMTALNNAKAAGLGDAIPLAQAAHINALKEASTLGGEINPVSYAKSLQKTLQQNPTPFNNVADKMTNLAEALQVPAQLRRIAADQTAHSFGQKVALGVFAGATGGMDAGLGTAAAAYGVPKATYFYTAGRLLKDPETAALLERAGNPNLSAGVRGAVQKAIRDKYNAIASGFSRVASRYGLTQAPAAVAKSVPVAVTNTLDQYQPPN